MAVRLLNLLGAFYFLIVALLQMNDPDPWLWTSVYLTAFVLASAVHLDVVRPNWLHAFAVATTGGMVLVAAVASDWGWTLKSESFREACGLGIAAGWAVFVSRQIRRQEAIRT